MLIISGTFKRNFRKDETSKIHSLSQKSSDIIYLKFLDFTDCTKFFPDYSKEDQIKIHCILGGTPFYLKQFDPNESIENNIKNILLNKGSIMYQEVDYTLSFALKEKLIYDPIIRAIAFGNSFISDISKSANIKNPKKTYMHVKQLVELGIINEELHVNFRGIPDIEDYHYSIHNPYIMFYYRFIFPNITYIETKEIDYVYKKIMGSFPLYIKNLGKLIPIRGKNDGLL